MICRDMISFHAPISRCGCAERQKLPVAVYSDEMSVVTSVFSSNELYGVLVTNRNTNSFRVYFQPVVDATTFKVMWHEWSFSASKETDGRYQSPLPYLAVAKSTGFDRYITEYVIGEACQAIETLRRFFFNQHVVFRHPSSRGDRYHLREAFRGQKPRRLSDHRDS